MKYLYLILLCLAAPVASLAAGVKVVWIKNSPEQSVTNYILVAGPTNNYATIQDWPVIIQAGDTNELVVSASDLSYPTYFSLYAQSQHGISPPTSIGHMPAPQAPVGLDVIQVPPAGVSIKIGFRDIPNTASIESSDDPASDEWEPMFSYQRHADDSVESLAWTYDVAEPKQFWRITE